MEEEEEERRKKREVDEEEEAMEKEEGRIGGEEVGVYLGRRRNTVLAVATITTS